ncbi:MAG: exosortase J [Gammaproteobacteria bacterium]
MPESEIVTRSLALESPDARERRRAWLAIGSAALVLTLGFVLCFSWHWASLWWLWTSDPLRSIGMAIPVASLVLAIRAWRVRDFSRGGTWWGLPLVLVAAILALLTSAAPLVLRFHIYHSPGVNLIPEGLLLSAYASGVVLLFGGPHTWRRAWFPLLLLICVNPVPGFFNSLVDLPLQYFASHAARGFAALIGVPVSQGTLRMMFTPHLGMFIAPGCDGMRGAVTMGYLALVIGYLYRLRWFRWGVYVVAAIALAYVFNVVRLCGVVGYYWFAMRFSMIADHGTLADYLIGGILFFCAALFLFSVPRWWRNKPCT